MKNCWSLFLLSLVLATPFRPVIAKTSDNESDLASERVHRRAELRSALSLPSPPAKVQEEKVPNNAFHEHQLSIQQRADLRRQLREQVRDRGLEAAP